MSNNNLSNMSLETSKVWEKFNHQLINYILTRVQNKFDSDDILQDVFLKIHNKIHTLSDNEKIEQWIYKIAHNIVIDYFRKNKSNREITSEIPDHLEGKDFVEEEDIMKNAHLLLKPVIDELPEKYRQPLIMTEYEGQSQKEVAKKIGLSLPGAKSRVQRARKKIKQSLLDCCHFELDRYGNILDYYSKDNLCRCYFAKN